MKKINFAVTFFVVLVGLFATQVTLNNLIGPSSASGTIAVFQPNGKFSAYSVKAPLVLDNTGQAVSVVATSAPVLDNASVLASASQTQPLPAPSCKLLDISWNGLRMSPTIDYAVTNGIAPANGTITFVTGNPLSVGDTLRITCFQ